MDALTNPTSAQDLRLALPRSDPALSRFDPRPPIIAHDSFTHGRCGWTQLVGNYEGNLDTMLPGYAQHSRTVLSTLSHWGAGSHDGMNSSYALKIAATTPVAAWASLTIMKPASSMGRDR